MSDQNELPSKDPANDDDLGGMLTTVFKKLMQRTDGMLPATVVSYDRDNNVATVQPSVMVLTTSGTGVRRASIASVPVLALGGGGFALNFPLKQGDTGWIEASDRDISLYMQGQRESVPNTLRLHSFEDGRFIPDVFKKYTIAGDDNSGAVLQSLDGSVKVVLTESELRLTAPTIKLKADALIDLDAPVVNIKGASAQITVGGNTDATGNFIINSIPFGTHRHTNVQNGTDNSGGPIA